MGKLLVEYGNVKQYICHEEKKIYVDNTMILTPGAKDYLSQVGVGIVYGAKPGNSSANCPEVKAVPNTELIAKVVCILKNDYGITDAQKLCNVTTQVLAKLQSK